MSISAFCRLADILGTVDHGIIDNGGTALTFAATGIGFTVYGVPLAQDSALIDTGLDFALGPRTTAGVSYSAEIAHNVHDNAVKGRLTWLF